ncbi:MAG: OmpA family protein, partial [Desulfobulbaceae bacterium]|nr:OmpA family protein [Desulfobulbaceae bacterium]
ELVKDIKRLHVLAQLLGKMAYIEIVGHADSIGSEKTNLKISRERADRVLSMLISKGLKIENFTTTGVGSKEPLKQEISEMDRELNRCVTFRVIFKDNLL